ncbi:MAG TPA: glycosyltransferase [Tahibacter sp.]|uniref:glycosyltransferase n=1 Tax=Tahibacter sp. TaxID=2056211 RepID=UPI002BFD261D|nr:glycosyltransferase [Tahibacter sp.]HSX58670.1 glycosyltransferase [Tahibacter sp.]
MTEPAAADRARAAQALQHGVAAGRGGNWMLAAQHLRDAWRADPAQPLAAQGLLECAARLVGRGQSAPRPPPAARASGAISIVVCSIDPARLARLRVDLDRELAGEDWELVHVEDARSLNDGYGRGLARSRGELVVLCHDDIGILTRRFAARLRERLATHDLVGAAGTDRLTGPKWFWSGPPHTASWVCEPLNTGWLLGLLGSRGVVIDGAQALDGLFLAGRRAALLELGFDSQTFDGFHFYDLDLSWRAHRAGLRCAVALDLLLWHASGGNFAGSWQHYAQRFIQKFPDLAPTTPCAAYRPGTMYCAEETLIEPIFDWIGHWLGPALPD